MPNPYYASVILSLTGVVGESLSFSTLQKMQRWLRPDSNARLEATYPHSLIRRRARNDHGHRGTKFLCCKFLKFPMVTEAWNPAVRARSWIQLLWPKKPKLNYLPREFYFLSRIQLWWSEWHSKSKFQFISMFWATPSWPGINRGLMIVKVAINRIVP